MQDGPPLPRFWHVSSSAHFILQNNTHQERPCKVTVLLQLPFSEGNKEQLLWGNDIQLLMALFYFKDIQHKLQANLDVSVPVTSEKSTPRTAEATTAEPGPRCSSSGPFRRVGNNKESVTSRMGPGSWHTAVRDTARSTGTAGWKTRGTGRSKGKICGYERSLCPGQEVPHYSHFHLRLSTRLSSPGVWNEQRKA